MTKPIPDIGVRGIRQSIPSGYLLGRQSQGSGPVELIPVSSLAKGQGVGGGGGGTSSIETLSDVLVTTLSDAQILVYNSTANRWENKSVSGDVTITDAGVATIKTSVALAGSPTTTTQASSDNSTKVATTAFVQSAIVAYDATLTLHALADVTVTEGAGIDGYVLYWNNGASKWEAKQLTLSSLTDVNVTEGAGIDGFVLYWDNGTGKWKAEQLSNSIITGLRSVAWSSLYSPKWPKAVTKLGVCGRSIPPVAITQY